MAMSANPPARIARRGLINAHTSGSIFQIDGAFAVPVGPVPTDGPVRSALRASWPARFDGKVGI
jgi:hypothetical protein